jgi:DNA replication protein DnaC
LQWGAKEREQHQAVMFWLSPIDFAARQHDTISCKEKDTGQWFLDSAEFEAWQQGSEKTLFCPGIPGAGKTMMAAVAIDYLCKRAQTEDIGVAYVFCSYKNQLEQTVIALLAAVVKQLVQSRPDIAAPIAQMYENHQKHKT